jgi:O-antigen/teichoic acid export membrane protein
MSDEAMTKPKSVVVNFTMASMGLMASAMLSNLVIIRWLEPEETGVWQTLVLAQSYMAFAQLGFFNGLNREFPFWVGKGDVEKAHRMAATTLTQSLFCALFSFLLFGGALLYFGDERTWLLGLTAMGVMTSAGFYRDYLAATYRTSQAFGVLAKVHWIHALTLLATVPLVTFWGFDGLCARLILVGLVVPFFMHRSRPVDVKPSWDWVCVRELLSAGTPLLALSYLITLANGFDRIILLGHVGILGVGLFAPAIAIKNGIQALPAAINQFISPRLSQALGESGDPRALWRTSWIATVSTCLSMVPVVVIGWFALPPLIEMFFPKYTAAIEPAQLLLLSGLFSGISAGTAVLASLKAWLPLTLFSLSNLGLFWFLPSYYAAGGDSLVGVATGWLVARAILLPVGLILIYFATHRYSAKAAA